jgi:predicted DNA-binding protein
MSRKSEVYTWRVSPSMKASLEEAARNTNRSVARLLDEIVAERLNETGQTGEAELDSQRRLHARAARFAGRFSGTDPVRSAKAKDRVRARLTERRVRVR